MNLKIKIALPFLVFAGLLLHTQPTHAAALVDYVPITGTAFGDKIGLVHMNYVTAKRPGTEVRYDSLYYGPTKQFYISPYSGNVPNPDYTSSWASNGNEDYLARISQATDDCTVSGCFLKGFMWADTIGWIALDGRMISEAVNTALGLPKVNGSYAIDDTKDGSGNWLDAYPNTLYPRITRSGAMTGLAWNKHTGWIILSSDTAQSTNLAQGTLTAASSQSKTDFGAWLELSGANYKKIGIYDIGNPFHGNIWSQNLGWIKLGKESAQGDSFAFDFAAYTVWQPDDTPPFLSASQKPWFAVGVNSGYDSRAKLSDGITDNQDFNNNPAVVSWKHFAVDPDSGISTASNTFEFMLERYPGETDLACSVPVSKAITLKSSSDNIKYADLILPTIGQLGNPILGYCKYKLSGVYRNNGPLYTYIGDFFLPADPLLMAKLNAEVPNPVHPEIIVYVRPGNPDITKSTVTPDASTLILADGVKSFKYLVNLNDLAGNSIRDIHCGQGYSPSSASPSYQYQEDPCPNREVTLNADIKNDLVYDLTNPPIGDHSTPVRYSEKDNPSNGQFLSSTDLSPEVEWDKALARGFMFNLASYAPSASASFPSSPIQADRKFQVDQFQYMIANDALPYLSQKLKNIADPTQGLEIDPDSVVPAYDIDKVHYELGRKADGVANGQEAGKGFTSDQISKLMPKMNLTASGIETPGLFTKLHPNLALPIDSVELTFIPAVTIDAPELESSQLKNIVSIGVPADLKYTVSNASSKAIAVGESDGGLSIDNIFKYTGDAEVALMETHQINQTMDASDPTPPPHETELGWTDPVPKNLGWTRYELFYGKCFEQASCTATDNSNCITGSPCTAGTCVSEAPCNGQNSPFHTYYSYLHSPKDFCFDYKTSADLCDLPNTLDTDGIYNVSARYSIPQKFEPLPDGTYPTDGVTPPIGKIDRNDPLPRLALKNLLSAPDNSAEIKMRFTPNKFVPVTIDNITMKLYQDIAYRYGGQPISTVYRSKLGIDPEVQDIHLQAKGTVAGDQIVTGRKYETVGTESTKNLQEQIRRNVAQLLSGVDTSGCKLSGAQTVRDTFDTSGACYVYDTVNKRAFKYYEGDLNQTLVFGSGTDLVSPSLPSDSSQGMPYTVIVRGGANVFLRNNIIYDAAKPNSSLGFILIADEIGKGANVFISPTPTNIVGTLYAEGSLMGCSDSPTLTGNCSDFDTVSDKYTGTRLFYGGGKAEVSELNNQLYWIGSIASRNTIAGAGIKKVPDGAKCVNGDTEINCAQRYDLDYLRRFTAVVDPANAVSGSVIANDGKFSGGGSCPAGTCALGTLPSTVKLVEGAASGQIDKISSELSTFYIEPSSRTANNPPPGFSTAGGQESTQTIR